MSFLSDLSNNKNLSGMLAAIVAFFMLAVMNVFAKLLSDTHHVIELAFYRNAIACIPFLFMIFAMGRRDILKINVRIGGVVTRAVLGTVSLCFTFSAFAHLPMADATVFLFSATLFASLLSIFFLHEKVGLPRWGALLIGFLGVVIVAGPTGEVNLEGVIYAMSAATMIGILQVILRSLGKSEKPETVAFYFVSIGTVILIPVFPFVFTMPTMIDIPLIIGCGLSGALAQYLLSFAFSKLPVSVASIFNYSGILWAMIFGWVIWQDWPTLPVWIGGIIVIGANLFILWREGRVKKP